MSIPSFGRAGHKAFKGCTALMLFRIGAFLMPGKGGKMNKETIKRQTGGGKLPDAEKAKQSRPDYFRVTVTGIRMPAGTVGYRVPSTLYDGTKLSMMLWKDQLVKMFPRDNERSNFLRNVVPGVTLDVIGIMSRRNNELELSVRRLAGKVAGNGQGV